MARPGNCAATPSSWASVGHTVTITGVRHQETKAEEAKEQKAEAKETKEAEANEAGDLRVTSLKMVSDSCKQ